MNAQLRLCGLVLFLPALLALNACEQNASTADSGEDVRIVARVNDEPISETMLELHVRRRTGKSLDGISADKRETLLLELVEMALIAQDARSNGLADDPRVRARMRNMHYAVLAQAMLEDLKGRAVSEDRMRERFNEAVASGEHSQEFHARHILLRSAEEAREVIEALDDGADFARLARERSHGPTASRGGDLGWVVPGEMVATFGEAIKELEVGEYTHEPIRTRYGHHVIKLEDRREREPPRFEQMTGHLRNELAEERINAYVRDLRQNADVELYRPKNDSDSE
ncbi:peptidylprolyl isomerase [Aquisalimonas lutea]|uniref:peptidylprolyl isomerase n=1 Tax=Aquisalimonas lutea TaxID=1327750 RepID=UPI0025B44575|nr:peptidylprolyl isomerase [Aquisalimonas lutea]MDN3517652.1 peptidylprolyl isomerase [Aquisalimonas lutea]